MITGNRASNSTEKTISDFGEQWVHYTENDGYYGSTELLADLVEPLLHPSALRGARVVDIGSGTGRIVRMLAHAGAAHILAVEPSAAIGPLRANTAEFGDRVTCLNVRGDELPAEGDRDFVVSFGVLHHIPDPAPVMRAAFAALKPGGTMIAWLYGREGNELYLALATPLRFVTTRLPHRALETTSRILAVPLTAYASWCERFPLPMRAYMTNHIAKLTPEQRRLTIYDQLNPTYAKYYTRDEAEALFRTAGFVDVQLHHRHGYSWTVAGQKPRSA